MGVRDCLGAIVPWMWLGVSFWDSSLLLWFENTRERPRSSNSDFWRKILSLETHQKRFRVNQFRRCFEPDTIHCFRIDSCTIWLAVVVLEVIHGVMGVLNHSWTGSKAVCFSKLVFVNRFNWTFVNQFKHHSRPFDIINYKRPRSTMPTPCIMWLGECV